jgi:3-deoxy-D-manno-octulosonic-acid transferase
MRRSFALSTLLALRRGGEGAASPYPTRPQGPLVWLQAADSTRAAKALALAETMAALGTTPHAILTCAPDHRAAMAEADRALSAGHQFCATPDDMQGPVRAFLDHWRPQACVWLGGGLRPVLLAETEGMPIHCILADVGEDDLTLASGAWLPGLTRALMLRFDRIIVRDEASAQRLDRLGVPDARVEVGGTLDLIPPILPWNDAERRDIAETVGSRPLWLAAQAPMAEIDDLIIAAAEARRLTLRLLLVIVPADIAEGPAIAERFRAAGHATALRSDGVLPDEETEVYVADLPGELGLWYRLAPLCYVGGTLSGQAPPDPLAPAALGSAILHGRRTGQHTAAFRRLTQAGGARLVGTAADLGGAVEALLQPDRAATLAHAAWDVATAGAGLMNRIDELVRAGLQQAAART